MAIAAVIIVPFVLSLLVVLPAVRQALKREGMTWLMTGTMAALFIWLLTLQPTVATDGFIETQIEWVPQLGLSLTMYLDGLALLFALVVTGIGIAVFFYAGYYMDGVDELGRFYMYLAAFAGSMLALVTAGNVITLFVAWELTSVTSFMLIGFKGYKDPEARIAANRALLVTAGGGLAMLVGLILMGVAANDVSGAALFAGEGFELSNVLGLSLVDHPWYSAITLLLMLGAFTKSAQFPFHFWLPGAMTAPSPASSYLHSATMVKAGVYLLFRFYPVLGDTPLWQGGLMGIGLTTMFIGSLFAIRKRDLKGLLAYSTVSTLGLLVALIGVPDGHGLKAAAVGILAHAMYKGTLFLLAGTIEHSTGTRNLDQLGGLRHKMPGVFAISAVVGLSMAGFPPLVGFVAKELLLDELLYEPLGMLPIIVAFVSSVLTGIAALLFVWDVFISNPDRKYEHFHAPHPLMQAGPALLAIMSILTGLFISPMLRPIVVPVVGETSLYLFPPGLFSDVPTAFILSTTILILGPVLFIVRGVWLRMPWFDALPSGAQIYALLVRGVELVGDLLLMTQGGRLRYYLIGIMGVVAGLMAVGGTTREVSLLNVLDGFEVTLTQGASDALKVMLLLLAIGATLGAIVLRRHILAALAMGVSGYAIGGLFLLEPAPDVALVQFLVETLATVLIILMVTRISVKQREQVMKVLWRGASERRGIGIVRDVIISVIIGTAVGLFALAAVEDRDARVASIISMKDPEPIVSQWYIENAYPQTGVTDVVASILTDFRGTDTLLEITVFSMAAFGVLTLLAVPKGFELLTGRPVSEEIRSTLASSTVNRLYNRFSRPTPAAVMRERSLSEGKSDKISIEAARAAEEIVAAEKSVESRVDPYGGIGDVEQVPLLSTPLTRTVAAITLPFAIVISLSHILYGAGAPGDGFTAGVVSGLAVALWYVVFGYFETRARLYWLRPGRLIVAGLLLAIVNAGMGILFSEGFFRLYEFGDGSGPAGLHLSSSLLFEVAIFLAVFGGVTTIMEAIAHPERIDRQA